MKNQMNDINGEAIERLLDYWQVKLANAPTLDLPTDRLRPTIQSLSGKTQVVSLSLELTEGLKALSQREDVSLFMTLVAAFQVLLHRYSGQDDIVLGAGSERNASTGVVVNPVALRMAISGQLSFRELLAQVRDTVLEAEANQAIPFEKLLEQFNLQADSSRHPLFQVMFVLHAPISKEVSVLTTDSSPFDLTLELFETPNGLTGSVEYATDLFDAETIVRLIGHFQILLEGIVAQPEARLSEFPLLTEVERQQLLVAWNNTAVPFPTDRCIYELFEAQVAKTPDAMAVIYEDSQLSYAELNAQANQLAHHLRTLGVKPDTLVAICVERCLNMVVGLLAILKAGGAYIPLDPAYPKDRLVFMLEDSQPLALLTQSRLESLFDTLTIAVPMLYLDVESPVWASQPSNNLNRHDLGLTPAHLAYVIYTSGSTGKPKGVQITHGAFFNFLMSMGQLLDISDQDVLLAVTTLSFDIAGLEIYLPLIYGAKIFLARRDLAMDGLGLAKVLNQDNPTPITLMQATPATWRLLLAADWQGSPQLKILCGGEALARDLAIQLQQKSKEVWNLYGPTETTVWSTIYRLPDGITLPNLIPIGKAIANTQLYVLDTHLQLVPIGVVGELHIGGDGLARGYLNRPELTAEKFIKHPYSDNPQDRLYKTGDLARWLPDASIEFLGRNDFQVKIRGFRIELGDIDVSLRQHPQLREVVVGVYEPTAGDKRLVAYLVARNADAPSVSELRDFLKPVLPEFMIPSTFLFLKALPLTPNGKLDRKALPQPDQNQYQLQSNFVAPRNTIEQQLAEIWGNVLSIHRVGIHDNFFELGGHSLLAVKMIVEINKLLSIDLHLGTVYQFPTIEELGIVLSSGNSQASLYSLVPIHTHGSRYPLFAIHTITLEDLPKHLGNEQPLYFLRYGMAAGVSDTPVHLPSLEELASHYINEMQQAQPQGPYHLIGFSFGGLIAYEMAGQLLAKGHQVNLVGLLDTFLTSERQLRPLHQIIHKFPSRALELIKSKVTQLTTPRKNKTDFWPHVYTPEPDEACRKDYQLKSNNAQVTLFQGWAMNSDYFIYKLPEHAWKEMLGDKLDVQQIHGSHYEIFNEPHVKILAAKIIACMDKVMVVY